MIPNPINFKDDIWKQITDLCRPYDKEIQAQIAQSEETVGNRPNHIDTWFGMNHNPENNPQNLETL